MKSMKLKPIHIEQCFLHCQKCDRESAHTVVVKRNAPFLPPVLVEEVELSVLSGCLPVCLKIARDDGK